MAEAEQLRTIIEAMLVPNMYGRVYVLGCFEKRVTILSQQVRALNLVNALRLNRRIVSKTPIAIIGGGVAGLTAAVAAQQLGADVTVLDLIQALTWPQDCIHVPTESWAHEGLLRACPDSSPRSVVM